MKTRFIVNPISGRGRRTARLEPAIREFIARERLDAGLDLTARPGHATELARAAAERGCVRVIAVGGDGTVNEVAQALVGTSAALGIVPAGSGNGLALALGLPTRPALALALAADPRARIIAIDTGVANGHPFFNVMGLGFDAEVSRRVNRLAHRGLAAYLRTGLAAFVRHQGQSVTVSDDNGRRETLDTFLVSVGNSDQYGNRARFAPGARVDDGQLDLVAVRPTGWLAAPGLAARLFLGNFDRSPRVRRLRGAHFVIQRPSPGLIHTDGETHDTAATVEITVRPRSLRLIVPAAHG
ncbi:MAG TPA: diacylglycerol kinase family protein [Opitutaceae bacterium]|nr:diacylglycerol kinase family protein [Opitutaceae bacterium]